jgi:hypothetical protein
MQFAGEISTGKSFSLTYAGGGDTLGCMRRDTAAHRLNRSLLRRSTVPLISLTALLCAAVLLGACSSSQQVELAGDGSGSARVEVELHPLMVRYIKDIAAGFSAPADENGAGKDSERENTGSENGTSSFRAFDEQQIRRVFREIDGTALERLELPGPGTLRLRASFQRIDQLLPGSRQPGVTPPIRLQADGGQRSLEIRIDRENYTLVYPLLGMDEQNALATFGPQQEPYSETEYLDMMGYALGDYAGRREVEKALRGGGTELTVQVDGPIVAARGFEPAENGRAATAKIPFLRFATLAEPIELSLTWESGKSGK